MSSAEGAEAGRGTGDLGLGAGRRTKFGMLLRSYRRYCTIKTSCELVLASSSHSIRDYGHSLV